ncbi:hypothetical protein CB0940_10185 [Cercospora beticola]|uniref:(S)-2-haloacid dehalogenase 4A n=2 Tax=Cercospora beticola TaxID=122368 RepID=A0A2G5HUB3_CERBT|nr:hypothetical protein CB0940_10185 [Cercospora beticola]PIA95812.1 hypothetical protein CB0940_10185 [Cercospora beticola]WPB06892.1 hypothetical protein RHO25_011552 [Cercospora beticola]CAK1366817.1 unnamed protein product [Cercospora beticola]
MSFDPQPKALFFDVFGTCVDWRSTVTDALESACSQALNRPTSSIATRIRLKTDGLTKQDWGSIAQEWRNSYLKFTRSIARDPTIPYKTVDQHHLDSLREILIAHELILPREGDVPAELVHDGSLFDEQDLVNLSLIWHRLAPWPDTVQGLHDLNKKFSTITLSNGNVSLLEDMVKHGSMPFTHIYSAEMFQSYKPSPKVYLGAAEKMGLQPAECMMVAAHLDDLKYAKQNGFRTLYVERSQEERHPELLDEGIPDVWVKLDEEGFVEAARKLGIGSS